MAEEQPSLLGTWFAKPQVQTRQGSTSAEAELEITEQNGPLFRGTLKWKFDANRQVVSDGFSDACTDVISLDSTIFTTLSPGALSAADFANFPSGAPVDATDQILYNSTTGARSYDADGSGVGLAVQFATLDPSLTLSNTDFVIV